jgi:lipoprotein-anchoring transpeptidase ErfK/SrfK
VGRSSGLPASTALGTKAFKNNPSLVAIAEGVTPAMTRGIPKNDAVGVVQTLLYSLGLLPTTADVDRAFGPKTEAALKSFQGACPGLPVTGKLDAATVKALDAAANEAIETHKSAAVSQGSKRAQFDIVVDIASSSKARIYVLDSAGEPVARYLTSPGTTQYPTVGNSFRISEVFPRRPWNPPASAWAANAKPVAPGIHNPMGILKLSLGAYSEYIHGVPAHEEPELGHAASHGCLRMSGANILEFHEKYCEAGSKVSINRNMARSEALEEKIVAAGLSDRPIDAGRVLMFGYVSGELGAYQKKP